VLVRPISFFEFYGAQFMGYKAMVTLCSFMIPVTASYVIGAPLHPERLPMMFALVFCYLFFTHILSFCVATLGFFMNRAHAITGMKNLAIWTLAGELIPLDLYPEPLRAWLIHSPFAAAVYLPVGYVIGRVEFEQAAFGFVSLACGIAVMGAFASWLWRRGLRAYTGTGA
ncbi:MAG TPA: ABC-2 family transporter protein, partial [Bdellovibrionales bacterium]|nr:ABC-2 family transporter protein [Bdellovibrionales bacterium]